MEATFGHDVDFATIVKHYAVEGTATDAAHRYSPSKVTGSERTVIRGRPATEHISTSYVERFNLSVPDADAPVYPPDERILQEARESSGRDRVCGFASTISAAFTKRCA